MQVPSDGLDESDGPDNQSRDGCTAPGWVRTLYQADGQKREMRLAATGSIAWRGFTGRPAPTRARIFALPDSIWPMNRPAHARSIIIVAPLAAGVTGSRCV